MTQAYRGDVPQHKKCGEYLENVGGVIVKIERESHIRAPINYCPKCKAYFFNKRRFKHRASVRKHIEENPSCLEKSLIFE